MDDKKSREAAISAKIASIRAANEALEKRHAEVQADKYLAEKKKMAVETRTDSNSWHEERGSHPPLISKFGRQNIAERTVRKIGGCAQDRLQREDQQTLPVKSRLGPALCAPPPDPSYNFLADRSREDSDQEYEDHQSQGSRSTQKQRSQGRQRHKPDEKRKLHQGDPERNSQPRRFTNESKSENEQAKQIFGKEVSIASDFREFNVETVVKPATSSQLHSRTAPLRQPKKFKCSEPACNNFGPEKDELCTNCRLDKSNQIQNAAESEKSMKTRFREASEQPVYCDESYNNIVTNSWQPMPLVQNVPIDNWQVKQMKDSQKQIWSHQQDPQEEQPFEIGNWGQPSEPQPSRQHWEEEPNQAWSNDPGLSWAQHSPYSGISTTLAGNNVYALSPQSYQPSHFCEVLVESGTEMVTQAGLSHGIPAQAYISNAQNSRQQYFSGPQSRPFRSNGNHPWDTSYRKPSSMGSFAPNWRDTRDREITRIPLKFQKQRMPMARHQQLLQTSTLPCAKSSTPPPSAIRLTILASEVVLCNLDESDLSQTLGLPVRTMEASSFKDFRDKLGKIDPDLDLYVLIHGLSCEVKKIASQDDKTDLQKGAESDQISLDFSEIVEDLANRIPYLKIFISTLLPRFDNEDKLTMSSPNVVRRVMNVELTSRLAETKNVIFLNNDPVLEWLKDDVKKNRLFSKDGERLTPYGFSLMLDNWMVTFKEEIAKQSDGSTEESDCSPPPSEFESSNNESQPPQLRQPGVSTKQQEIMNDLKDSSEAENIDLPSKIQDSSEAFEVLVNDTSELEIREFSNTPPKDNEDVTQKADIPDKEFQEKDNYEAMEKDAHKSD